MEIQERPPHYEGPNLDPTAVKLHPRFQAVRCGELRAFACGPVKHADLMAKRQGLELQYSTRAQHRGQSCQE